jgi:hypothetical protein
MSQFPHDEFIKEYLPELIQDYGEGKSGEDVNTQRKEIDVFFQANQEVTQAPKTLGLLGKLLKNTVLFEVFRNPVETHQITDCLGKLFDVQSAMRRERRKSKQQLSSESEAFLWILTPTLGEEKLNLFKAETSEDWGKGIYILPAGLNTGIVVIHQLPVNEETLWLRILGKGKVQENAIDELKALPKEYPHRDNVLELIGCKRSGGVKKTKNNPQNQAIKLSSFQKIRIIRTSSGFWKQGRCSLSATSSNNSHRHKLQNITLLGLKGCHHSQHPSHKITTSLGLRAKTGPSPNYSRANSSFRGIVGWLNTLTGYEQPHCWFKLE